MYIPHIPEATHVNSELEFNEDPNKILNELNKKNIGRLIFGQLNINSLRNKFEALKPMVQNKVDVPLIWEIKLDESFPSNQFFM